MKRIHTLLLVLLLTVQHTLAGTNVTKLFRSNELSSTLITKIEQDKHGFIWVATEYGLNRFDGYTFHLYYNQPDNPKSLADNSVHNVVATPDGSLWVCSSRLQRYDPVCDRFDNVDADGVGVGIADMEMCGDSAIYAVGYDGALYRYDSATRSLRLLSGAKQKTDGIGYYFVSEDPDGKSLWIGGRDGLMRMNRHTLKAKRYGKSELGHTQTSAIYIDGNGTMYIVTPVNILRYDRLTDTFSKLPIDKPISLKSFRCISNKGCCTLMFGTFGSGSYRYNTKDGTASRISIEVNHNDISAIDVSSIFCDRDNNLWIGCFQKGVALIPHRPTSFAEVDGASLSFDNHYPLSLLADAGNGEVWIGQGNNGLHLVSVDGRLLKSYLPNATPIAIHRDSKQRLWVGLYDEGVGVLNTANGTIDKLREFPYKRVRAIDEDSLGNIYFAMFNYGIHSFNIYSGATNALPAELNTPQVMTLRVDSHGLLWIGSYEGLKCYDTAKRCAVSLPDTHSPVGSLVNTIAEDSHGDMWIATSAGLYHYLRGENSFHRIRKADGLPDDMVCDVQVTTDDEVWISTYKGICCYKPVSNQFFVYSRGNGLNGMAFLRSVGAYTSAGQMLFAYDDGYIHFNPQQIDEVEPLSQLYLSSVALPFAKLHSADDSVRVSAYTAEMNRKLRLKYDENVVVLRFLSLDHIGNDNLCLQYRFSNLQGSGWITCREGENSIQLGPLSPGHYDLEVRTTVSGVNSPSRHYEIVIGHPWYTSWWMWCVYALIAIAFVYQLFVGYNNYLIRRRNEERIRFFIDLTHELRSPTTLMLSPLQELVRREWDEETGRLLRAIYRNGNRLLQLLNQILDVRKIDKGRMFIYCSETNIVQYVRDVFHVFEYEAEKRHIRFTFTAPADDIPLYIDRAHFDKVIYNLLTNAFKFVKNGGEIGVELSQTDGTHGDSLLIRVSDNGPGIDKEQVDKVFERFYQAPANKAAGRVGFGIGLNLCYNIVRLHHGTISVGNRTDGTTGAVFTITMPMGRDHLSDDELLKGESYVVSADPVKLIMSRGEEEEKESRGKRTRPSHTVLIADDDEDLLEYLRRSLSAKYRVVTCANGAEALSKSIEIVPDVVISDISMPEVDGFSLLTRLKNNSTTSHVPVILLTSLSEHENKILGLQKGADAYLEKPFDMEELEVRIQSLISTRTKLRGKFAGEQEQEGRLNKIEIRGVNEQLMEQVMKVINENLSEPELSVEFLAKQVGLSRTQLHRRMKEITGLSCGDFIRNIRMKEAARLLKEGDIYISQICYAVGYANPTHFSTAFKKYYGVTPSEYVASVGEGDDTKLKVNVTE
jgi:signal transduction histidine kinase/DNA-binding response OmpR family regulator/ligand-binding sensor domain-containing protein